MLTIGYIEKSTGISRDTLRVWEKRYGFPVPKRNTRGERIYSKNQLNHLHQLKILLDQGYRPGKIMRLEKEQIKQIINNHAEVKDNILNNENVKSLLQYTKNGDAKTLHQQLDKLLIQQGIEKFILETIAPLLSYVGEQWMQGKTSIFEEHFISKQITSFIEAHIHKLHAYCEQTQPVILSTLPSEAHHLSLLMIECLLVNKQQLTINLGPQVPIEEISKAAKQYQAKAIFLSFSSSYKSTMIRKNILELSDQLDVKVPLWISGSGVKSMRKLPDHIKIKKTLEDVSRFQ